MLMRVATTVGIVLACLFAMSVTAFAYFSHDVASGINILKSAWFNAEITVEGSAEFSVSKNENVSTYDFAPGEYVITLKMKDGSTAKTGFCIVKMDGKTYHTQQLGKDVTAEGQKRDSISFKLNVNAQSVVVMESHWGTSSFYGFDTSATNALYIVNSDPMQVLTVGKVTIQSPTPPPAEPTNPVTDSSTESTETSSSTSTDSAMSTSESSADTNSNVTTDSATEPSDTPVTVTDSETSSVSDTEDESDTSTEESATATSTDE